MTNNDTKSAPNHVTVARHSPSESRWAAQEAALEFGRFQMLLRRRQLIADGVPVKVGARAFDLLSVLLKSDGSLVTKEELVSYVWPGTHVQKKTRRSKFPYCAKRLAKIATLSGQSPAAATVLPRLSNRLYPGTLLSTQHDGGSGRVKARCRDG